MRKAWNFTDLTGRIFGRLTVQGHQGGRRWRCQCECGNTTEVSRSNLVSGDSRSCGCLKLELARSRPLRHGFTTGRGVRKTPSEYTTWQNIKHRCNNPKNTKFANYGGRGIAVCERWAHSFEAFLADMGNKPSARHTIERINSDGNYEPANCRWATWTEQQRNRSTNRVLTIGGTSMSVAEWAELRGIARGTVQRRLGLGWSPSDAVYAPTRKVAR